MRSKPEETIVVQFYQNLISHRKLLRQSLFWFKQNFRVNEVPKYK